MMKIPLIVSRSNSSDVAAQNESENASCASSEVESGNTKDSNDSEVLLSSTSNDDAKPQNRNKEHPSSSPKSVTDGKVDNSSNSNNRGRVGNGGYLRLPGSEDKAYHSASVEKERTKLREEGKEDVGTEEKDALRILGMVRE